MAVDLWMMSLPLVFILHDLEEIIMMPPWLRCHLGEVARRFPLLARPVRAVARLSASGFAVAVLVVFTLVLAVTGLALVLDLPDLWAGAVVVLLLHFLVHIAQFLVWRGYVPVIVTSVPGAIWCVAALAALARSGLIEAQATAVWALALAGLTAAALPLAHRIGAAFDRWAARTFPASL